VDQKQVESRVVRRGLLVILIGATLLLYCLGGASLWARRRFLDTRTATPAATPVATPTAGNLSLEWAPAL
jgi:hypothetical protein